MTFVDACAGIVLAMTIAGGVAYFVQELVEDVQTNKLAGGITVGLFAGTFIALWNQK